jgi:hypothetical protein
MSDWERQVAGRARVIEVLESARWIWSGSVVADEGRRWRAHAKSAAETSGAEAAERMRSPGWRPAEAAGVPLVTERTEVAEEGSRESPMVSGEGMG